MARAAQDAPFDPIAVSLATATPDGRPSCRIVLVHEVDQRGVVFHTNYGGRKGSELEGNPWAAICAYWPWIDEQIRIEGSVARVSSRESDGYFALRPRGSQIGAWASLQSQPLESRDALVARVREFETRFEGGDVPRPDHWGGYRLTPAAHRVLEGRPVPAARPRRVRTVRRDLDDATAVPLRNADCRLPTAASASPCLRPPAGIPRTDRWRQSRPRLLAPPSSAASRRPGRRSCSPWTSPGCRRRVPRGR